MIPRVIRPFGLHALHVHHHHHPLHVSRRDILLKSAGAFGLLLGAELIPGCGTTPSGDARANDIASGSLALDRDSVGTPVPVPANPDAGGTHIYFIGPGAEPSAISNFDGLVGGAVVDGTGVGHSPGGRDEQLLFDTDMRFMQGTFVGTDGNRHEGTFGFV
jgi:hypothetical protein